MLITTAIGVLTLATTLAKSSSGTDEPSASTRSRLATVVTSVSTTSTVSIAARAGGAGSYTSFIGERGR